MKKYLPDGRKYPKMAPRMAKMPPRSPPRLAEIVPRWLKHAHDGLRKLLEEKMP